MQRAALARALMLSPSFLVADEAVSKLDVSVRSQVLNLFRDMQAATGVSVLFITHDVDEAIFLGDRVLVMTARPGRVRLERRVALPRPRDPGLVLSPGFIALKRELLDAIEEESMKSFAASLPATARPHAAPA